MQYTTYFSLLVSRSGYLGSNKNLAKFFRLFFSCKRNKTIQMIQIEFRDQNKLPTTQEITQYTQFLFQHLEQYGDEEQAIRKALNYALAKEGKPGGFILVAKDSKNRIVGISVILDTQMEGFIPEHILVYIATDAQERGKGIGKQLMQALIAQTKGDIALHVEKDNPAKRLYEKLGFETKYLEMRLIK